MHIVFQFPVNSEYENENYSNLKNENDIKIKITAGRKNENDNYYKRKRKIWGQTTIQQYCGNLPWHSNANIT